ncbi:MAG: flagellar filament capping protein FliD [Gammaproteobacteria bacterium]|nr:flagellar filament capping protein FliD [Gammaproteobacteria bacterium]
MAITAPGIGSGLDVKSLVEQLVSAERQPAATRLASQEAKANAELTGIGRLKSALATFQSAVATLADIDSFQQRKATVPDDGRISATVTTDATPASYEVEVLALARAHRLLSGAFAGADSVVGEGQLLIGSGASSMQIEITPANNTLAGIRDAINASGNNPGVRASIVTGADGAHLILTATSTGVSHAITVDAIAPGSPLEALEFGAGTSNSMTESAAAADASLTIDGLAVTGSGNSIDSAIPGVTIDLLKAEPGVPVTLQVAYDKEAARAALGKFVEAYNAVVGTINELTAYNADTKSAGPLLGDAATRAIRGALREALGRSVGESTDPFRTLTEIGISSDTKGKLSLDSSKFDKAVAADFDGVGRVLAGEGDGIAVRMKAIVDDVLGSSGRMQSKEQTLKERLSDIGERRTALDSRMEKVQDRYRKQFLALDTLMSQLTQTSNYLTQQLARL